MKKLIVLVAMFIPGISIAETCTSVKGEETVESKLEISTDVPNYLKGATIIVRTKDGRESSVPAEKFKVVPRAQQFIVNKTVRNDSETCVYIKMVETEKEKNRISVLGGNGPKSGLTTTRSGDQVTVETNTGAIGGMQYQRLLTDKISVGVQGQTNNSVLINAGYDF